MKPGSDPAQKTSLRLGTGVRPHGYLATAAVVVVTTGRPFRWLSAALSCTSSFFAFGSFFSSAGAAAADLAPACAGAVADWPVAGPVMILSAGALRLLAGVLAAGLS